MTQEDLDKLTDEYIFTELSRDLNESTKDYIIDSYQAGFKKALELAINKLNTIGGPAGKLAALSLVNEFSNITGYNIM